MPSNLKIRVSVDGNNQTVSKPAVAEGGQVTLQNDATAGANLTFRETTPLCQASQRMMSIDLGAGDSRNFQVCPGTADQSFKYTATVTGAQPEDPYIFVEGPIGTPEVVQPETNPAIKFVSEPPIGESLFLFGAGLTIGIGATMLFRNLWLKWQNPPRI